MASKERVQWILDSGASHHMTPLFSILKEAKRLDNPFYITVPTGNTVLVEKMGNIQIDECIELKNLRHVPEFNCNLISIHKLTRDSDCIVTYHSNWCEIQDRTLKRTIGSGDMRDGVYVFEGISRGVSHAVTHKDITTLWHSRMGHPCFQALQSLSKFLQCSFNSNKVYCCDICHRAKHCRSPFPLSNNKTKEAFDLIHCDLSKSILLPLMMVLIFFLTIMDDYSRGTWVYLMTHKDQTNEILINFCNMTKAQFDRSIKLMRSDNGTEFTNSSLEKFLHEKGIIHESSCVATPQQNGRVERKHRHILNVARALKIHANLLLCF